MKSAVDPKDTFIIYMDVMVPVQLVPYSPVSHIRVRVVDFFHLTRDSFVFQLVIALRTL